MQIFLDEKHKDKVFVSDIMAAINGSDDPRHVVIRDMLEIMKPKPILSHEGSRA